MDITSYLDLRIAPRAVFDSLEERRTRARFMLPTGDAGASDWRAVTWGAFAQQIRHAALFLAAAGLKSGERGAVFAPNRVEWLSAALAIQAAGGVMVPIYASSTSEQAAYVAQHSDAKVIFVDTAPLLAKVLASWSAYASADRIVLLDDALDAAKVLSDLRARGGAAPAYEEVERKVLTWSAALAMGRARDEEDPDAFFSHDELGVARSSGAHALHERHVRQSEGGTADASERRRERARLAQVERAGAPRERRRSLVASDEPHLRLRRGVPR